jgi:hypothetical protein
MVWCAQQASVGSSVSRCGVATSSAAASGPDRRDHRHASSSALQDAVLDGVGVRQGHGLLQMLDGRCELPVGAQHRSVGASGEEFVGGAEAAVQQRCCLGLGFVEVAGPGQHLDQPGLHLGTLGQSGGASERACS